MTEGFLKPNAKTAFFTAILKFCIANQLFHIIIEYSAFIEYSTEYSVAQRSNERRSVVDILLAFLGKLATVEFRLIHNAMVFESFLTCVTNCQWRSENF